LYVDATDRVNTSQKIVVLVCADNPSIDRDVKHNRRVTVAPGSGAPWEGGRFGAALHGRFAVLLSKRLKTVPAGDRKMKKR
jgi:hypothetical protein